MLLHVEPLDTAVLAEQPPLWWIGWVFSTVTAVTFLAIGITLAFRLIESRTVRSNPLALATGLIFLTCGGGHLVHSLQLIYPWFTDSIIGTAARIHYMDWHLWVVDGFTAFAGTWYWTQRARFPGLVSGVALYEDLRGRKQAAMDLNDTVVQELNAARLSLAGGDEAGARRYLERARSKEDA